MTEDEERQGLWSIRFSPGEAPVVYHSELNDDIATIHGGRDLAIARAMLVANAPSLRDAVRTAAQVFAAMAAHGEERERLTGADMLPVMESALCGLMDMAPDLPPQAASWQKTGYLDENARLLVDAMYRHREALATDHANVPVQDHQVLPEEFGPTGAMTCGVLMALWEHSPLCSGTCPECSNKVLALAFMGSDTWSVTGVCTTCGYLAWRVVAADGFLDVLDAALEGTPYTLPTRNQMLSSNGLAHSALLPVLASLGEVMLPPAHYGFASSTPEGMRLWRNPLRARAWLWANKTTVHHVPTGARVDDTDSVFWPMVDFVYLYLRRTGTLPELEHLAEDQLRYCFPMISQEPVVVPPRALSA